MQAVKSIQAGERTQDWHVIYHDGIAVCVSDSQEGRISTLNQTNKRINDHACLIAAAPDLLRALSALVEASKTPNRPELPDARIDAIIAIRLAKKGRTS